MGKKLVIKEDKLAPEEQEELTDELLFGSPIKSSISESLFILLPLIVIALVLIAKGNLAAIFTQAEWAFGATVLSGQSITKIVLAVSRAETPSYKINNVILLISAIITLLLVPSLIVLALMLILKPIPSILLVLQIVLFVLSLLLFFFLHATAESLQGEHELRSTKKGNRRSKYEETSFIYSNSPNLPSTT